MIADSSCCLPPSLCADLGIRILPLSLVIGDEVIPDGSIPAAEMFRRLDRSRASARTAASSPGDFLKAFREARCAGAEAVLCLTLSADYSGTFAAARAAADAAAIELPDLGTMVVDTGGLAMAHGFAVLAAARAIGAGATIECAAETAQGVGSKAHIVGVLDTLRYAVRGGRAPRLAGLAATALRIKPVMSLDSGRPKLLARPRAYASAIDRMLDLVPELTNPRMAVMHCDAPELAAELAGRMASRFSPRELIVTEFTSVMAVHTGPNFLGIAYCDDDC